MSGRQEPCHSDYWEHLQDFIQILTLCQLREPHLSSSASQPELHEQLAKPAQYFYHHPTYLWLSHRDTSIGSGALTALGIAGTSRSCWLASSSVLQETLKLMLIFCCTGKSKIDLIKFEPVGTKTPGPSAHNGGCCFKKKFKFGA